MLFTSFRLQNRFALIISGRLEKISTLEKGKG